MKTRYLSHPEQLDRMGTDQLREQFLIEDLFAPGEVRMTSTGLDRLIVGGIIPSSELALPAPPELRSSFFHERRESGILNIGDPGEVIVDGISFPLNRLECLYIGMGVQDVRFRANPGGQGVFYLLSCPAHRSYPSRSAGISDAETAAAGSPATASSRTIHRYIHQGGIQSCQLVMGFTTLQPGSVWNTWPPHSHERRSEVYLYLDLNQNLLMHFMGTASHSRHLVVRDQQAVLSPPWSIHCGAGTAPYSFIWGMAGENKRFDDMDPVVLAEMR